MKKIISLCVILLITFTMYIPSVFAAVELLTVNADVDNITKEVTIFGNITSGSGKQITIAIQYPSGDLYVNQITSGTNGDYRLAYTLSNPVINAVYKVKVSSNGISTPVTAEFKYEPAIIDATISPVTASFDKRTSEQKDTVVTLASNGNTLLRIKNGPATLSLGSDFTMEGNTVTIRKEFWASLPIGTYVLTFYMDKGTNPTLTVEVKETTSPSGGGTTIPPTVTDKIEVKPVLNGTTAEAKVDTATLSKAFDAAASDANGVKTVTLKVSAVAGAKEYAQQLPAGTFEAFRGNEDSTKKITIDTPIGSLVVTDNMFKTNDLKNAENISITIGVADVSGLDKKMKDQIGSKPVVELNALVDGKKISWNNPKAAVEISLAYQPTAEELKNPEAIVVWYIDGKGKVQSVSNARYDAATGKVTFTTTHFSTYAVAYNFKTFGDAGKYQWAKKSIEVLASKGIMTGSSEALFSPEKNITRAEFIDGLIKALNLTAEFDSNFSDVAADSEYYTSIGIAKQLGITGGTGNNKFSPAAEITRQDMAALVVKAMKLAGINVAAGTAADLQKFSDSSRVAGYAADMLATLVKEGILVGSGDKITPAGNVTKAQTAVILYKLYNRAK